MGILTAALSLALAGGFASTTYASTSDPQPISNADANPGGANGQCPGGPYCSTTTLTTLVVSPSLNGNGNGNADGRPAAGAVGNADNTNPPGQMPNNFDPNVGYECDSNHGIALTNPAHTGCNEPSVVTPVVPSVVTPVVPSVVTPVVTPGRVLGVVANAPAAVSPAAVSPAAVSPAAVSPAVVSPAEAAAHPLPLAAAAGEASTSGQLAVGGFAAFAAFLALGAAFVLRRRNGEV